MRVEGVSSTYTRTRDVAIRRADRGGLPSFETFYEEMWSSIVAIARPFTTDTAGAEDLAQEALMKAYRRWDQVSRYDSPHAWVRRVLINRATSLRRRWGAELRMLERMGPTQVAQPDLSPETDELWDEVRRLPRRQQQAVALHYVGQLSMLEIADVMGCSTGAVKTHLHRARATLRRRLTDWIEESE